MKNKKDRVRIGLVQKQQVIFAAMLAVGGGLLTASLLTERFLAAEGIAFILVGLAGLLMSWTTFDIGAGIKETVREVGRQNREAIREASRDNMAALDRMAEAQKESQKETREMIAESQKETREMIAESQKETRELMAKMSESQDRISKSQDDIARLLERVVKNSGA